MTQDVRGTYTRFVTALQTLLAESPVQVEGLDTLGDEIQGAQLLVPVIGPFSAGKSNLLNSFMGESVLGVGITPETELATEIRYGEENVLLAFRPDGRSEQLEIGDLKSIKSRAGEFTHLQLYLDNPRLKSIAPLTLVDMPGFDSTLARHNQAISYYLPRGAHFVVLTNSESGTITQSVMRHLDDLHTYDRGLTFVLSKTNLRSIEEVNSVAALVQEQINASFGDRHRLVQAGIDGYEALAPVLERLDPDLIITNLYESRLKGIVYDALEQINVAEASLQRDEAENRRVVRELEAGLRKLEARRNEMVEDLRERRLDPIVDRCLSEVAGDLRNAQDELIHAAQNGEEPFSKCVSEIIRSAASRVVKREVNDFSRDIVDEFARSLEKLDIPSVGDGADGDWVQSISTRVTDSMQSATSTLNRWSESLAEHNARQLEDRTDREKAPSTTKINAYRGLATVLAVTTNVVAPLVELAIIFLPEVLSFIRSHQQKTRIRDMVIHEVIPSVQRQLRMQLGDLLKQQLDSLVSQVCETFEGNIARQKEVIDAHTCRHQSDSERVGLRLQSLEEIRRELGRLSSGALFRAT
ncbi:dynamin family protein [Luteimonas sp. MC1572]|uniref:dynamin family protein n=1 Tax=Luteimonas sp. MC1572 TaxID=2799325 RepID=UPI0018F0E546|nr:dynamin family protein [Luteimonas sp. MC1572]MBJ6980346.1 dynamin family protein [Luteimonas sp. MC1572]QQO04232.1 dynamin family protein [Luteimonas sp. MC1572]